MNPSYTTIRQLTGNPHLERFELQDIGARNVQDPDAFDHVNDEMTEAEIDRLYVEEMTRRDREAASVFCGTPDDGDDEPDPTRPGGIMAAGFAEYSDDDLITAISIVDRGQVEGMTPQEREQLLAAGSAEVLRRLAA